MVVKYTSMQIICMMHNFLLRSLLRSEMFSEWFTGFTLITFIPNSYKSQSLLYKLSKIDIKADFFLIHVYASPLLCSEFPEGLNACGIWFAWGTREKTGCDNGKGVTQGTVLGPSSPVSPWTHPDLSLGPVVGRALLFIHFPWLVGLCQHFCCFLFHLLVVLPEFLIKNR